MHLKSVRKFLNFDFFRASTSLSQVPVSLSGGATCTSLPILRLGEEVYVCTSESMGSLSRLGLALALHTTAVRSMSATSKLLSLLTFSPSGAA